MNLRYIDWIWHVRGSVALAPGQSDDEAFERLDPLFHEYGTSYERTGDTLAFTKKDPAAQDKMSVFDHGVLTIDKRAGGPVLRYELMSRILLFCFLAPLLFVAAGQLTLFLGAFEKPPTAAEKKKAEEKKKAAEKKGPTPLNPIDKFLGAPEPDSPKKKAADKEKADDKKPSAKPAYVFAGIFATLYLVGRILEAWLVRRLFRRRLLGS